MKERNAMKPKDIIFTEEEIRDDMRYLQLLSQTYPTIADASTEIINLEAINTEPAEADRALHQRPTWRERRVQPCTA